PPEVSALGILRCAKPAICYSATSMADVAHEASQRATLSRVFPGATLAAAQPLAGGISSGATRWDVVLANGATRSVVVRAPAWGASVSRQRLWVEARVL